MQYNIEQLDQLIDRISVEDNSRAAYDLYKKLKDFLEKNKKLKNEDDLKYRKLERLMQKCQFLALNHFEDWQEIYNLIENNFGLVFTLPEYNFWNKLKNNLIYITDIKERDKVKKELRKTLSRCKDKIIMGGKYNTEVLEKVSDWVKDFVVNFGPDDEIDKVKKAEYLNNSSNLKKLKDEDRSKVVALLNFYEVLGLSSDSPLGMEETAIFSMDNKPYLLSRRGLEDIEHIMHKIEKVKMSEKSSLDANNLNKDYQVGEDEDEFESPQEIEEKIKALQKVASNYDLNTLEFKALQEEIAHLKKKLS
ncbi:MAG: hypothetical protein K9M44_02040 [Candidatus Pacebacteria bacterium]|nr:hypothetical protein [Candidatus Paceibacterota bacterium]